MGFRKLLITCIMLVLGAASSFAQVTTGGITGSIKDATSNEMLIGATIKAVHVPTGTIYGTTTMENGRYNVPNMRVGGPYTITVTYVSYKEEKMENVSIPLGQTLRLDFSLQTAATGLQEVVVSGRQDKTFNSSRTGAATFINREQLSNLPTISRGVADFTKLTPQSGKKLNFAGRNGLYNSFTIDGSTFNNAFGITELPGGQTNAQPISLDAIEQLQVNLAPYDVKLSGFTGAGINAVTRGGTNEFSGSVYTFIRSKGLTGNKVDGAKVLKDDFKQNQYGFRVGGPIIKNKLFFFISGELERQTSPASNFRANRDTSAKSVNDVPAGIAFVNASALDSVRNLLISKYGYDPGRYEDFSLPTHNDKITARFDWNINEKNKLTFRYSWLNAYRDIGPSASNSNNGRGQSSTSLYFENMKYRQFNKLNSFVLEWNNNISNRFANNLTATYSRFRDHREVPGKAFPVVDLESGGRNYISFGSEPFSGLNNSGQDLWQITNNFNWYAGKHTLLFGVSGEYYQFSNGFAQFVYGQYRYGSVQDFFNAVDDPTVNPTFYQRVYSAIPGDPAPIAKLNTAAIAAYVQDEYQIANNFRLTYGVRIDVPWYPNDLASNPKVNAMTFRDGEKLDVGKLPKTQILWSPRLGFNWDVADNNHYQIRGGTGIFTGRIPYVWAVNQAGQNGLLFGSEFTNNPTNRPFTDNPNAYIPSNPAAAPTYAINVIDENFKYPQVWRSNLAADIRLPEDFILTLEGIYTKDLNAVFHRDANLKAPVAKLPGADNRPFFPGGSANRINSSLTNAVVLDNTSKGYSYALTAQLQKSFDFGLSGMVAYTYTDAKDVTSSPGSQAASAFNGNQIVGDPNIPVLARTNFLVRNRVIGTLSYNIKYAKILGTTLSLIYEGQAYNDGFDNSRISYVYGGSVNNDNSTSNDLIYIPRNSDEIILIPSRQAFNAPPDTRTPAQIWSDLDAYIKNNPYLNKRRGQYAERNGLEFPWANRFDFRLVQDIDFSKIAPKSKSKLQITWDIINVGNLLNSEWGVTQIANTSSFLAFRDFNGTGGQPRFSFDKLAGPFRTNTGIASRWQMQLGVRYIFNN